MQDMVCVYCCWTRNTSWFTDKAQDWGSELQYTKKAGRESTLEGTGTLMLILADTEKARAADKSKTGGSLEHLVHPA